MATLVDTTKVITLQKTSPKTKDRFLETKNLGQRIFFLNKFGHYNINITLARNNDPVPRRPIPVSYPSLYTCRHCVCMPMLDPFEAFNLSKPPLGFT